MDKRKQARARKRMKAAVESLQKYMATYDKQYGYEDYSDRTYIDDVLYGLGRSLSKEYAFHDGFERFKQRLLHHLSTR